MLLSPPQRVALAELVNIGFGRAAASLSALVRQRIQLQAPEVSVYLLQELQDHLDFSHPEVATVHQIFSGELNGDAMLMIDIDGAVNLIGLITGEPAVIRSSHLTASDREALVEVGNILLNAFVGSFGNLLNVHVTFAVPRLRVETVKDFLHTLQVGQQEIRYVLLVQTRFLVLEGQVEGFVALVMGIESLDKLFEAMEKAGYQI